jgi:MFS family permease
VYGRRGTTITGVSLFTLGSGISGGANTTATLLAGRLIQGLGAAGISAMTQIIISDLLPVRERSKYNGILWAIYGVGTVLGPPLGGIMAHNGAWRWIFWLNLPLGGLTLVLQLLFLKVSYAKRSSVKQLGHMDWFGNLLLGTSVVSILIALSWADTRHPWSSWRIIVPLVLGFAGIIAFHCYEISPWCPALPAIPPRIWSHPTSSLGMVLAFLQSMQMYWLTYFLPLYFQSVLVVDPSRSGVLLLPTIAVGMPAAVVAGAVLAKTGRSRPIQVFGFATLALGAGLYLDLNADSSLAKVVCYQLPVGLGGVLLSAMVPAVQAAHPQSDVAAVTAAWHFYWAFGSIWGIAIPAAIFNSQMTQRASGISDPAARAAIADGAAYAHVSSTFVNSLPGPLRREVVDAYQGALRTLWAVLLAVSVLALLIAFAQPEIPLQTHLEPEDHVDGREQVDDREAGTRSLLQLLKPGPK